MATKSKKSFKLSEQSTKFLDMTTGKPLKNAKRRQFLEQFPLPSDCDSAYPPKLDESMILIIPETAWKEDRLLSRLQQFSMDTLGALLSLQESLAKEEQRD